MKVVHVPCGPAVNESERKALERIKARLIAEPGSDEWLLLSNLAFSSTHLRQSDEIDIVAIGPPGVQVVEVKHWAEAWVKQNPVLVEQEAERVSEKARKIGTTLRKHVANLPKVDGVFLVTQAASKVATIKNCGPVRGVPFHTFKTCDDAVGLFAKKVLLREEIKKLGGALEPRSVVAWDGTLKRMADYARLTLLTPRDERFRRVYDATHTSRQDRVKFHLYDLSASDDAKALQRAEREWKSLNRLQRYAWAPRIMDSFHDAPGYPGEIKFFTMVDPLAPSIEKRAADGSWDIRARLIFARDSVRALREFHEAHSVSDGEPPMVHRNLTPRTILVKHDNSPIFTGFEQARIPADVSVASQLAEQEWEDEVAPEVRRSGLGAADQRSDVFSLCASLAVLFESAGEGSVAEIVEILAAGADDDPQKRLDLSELDDRLSTQLGEAIPIPPPPSARYWTEDQIVPFNGKSYRIVSSLGSGGVGTAFKVVELDHETQEELGTYVAKVARDEKQGRLVLRSYGLARAHLRHSALSIIFEVAREWRENEFVALMSWFDGEPLGENTGLVSLLADDLQQESGEALALGWLRDACDGLGVLHCNNLIHGDLSPRNMIVAGTKLVLTDYDCVTKIGTSASSPGTIAYCSPSREKGLDAAPSDDLFALAASFFHVLYEKEPFNFAGNRVKERGLNWDGANRDDHPLLSEFLDRATSLDQKKKLTSVADALALLSPPQHAASVAKNTLPAAFRKVTDWMDSTSMSDLRSEDGQDVRKPNTVEWLNSLLQSYPGSRWGNSETRGLDSEFATDTYVETKLENSLYSDIMERRVSLVVLCGNAGDGKTALLQRLAQRLGMEVQTSATRILEGRLDNGLTVRMNLDGSASWRDRSADDLLDEIFEPFHGDRPNKDVVHLLAINDGRLLEWIENGQETPLTDALLGLLQDQKSALGSHIRFVNLNRRSLVGAIAEGGMAIETEFLNKLVDGLFGGDHAEKIWAPCQSCSAQESCEVFHASRIFGPGSLAEATVRDRARERLFELLQAVHLRGETHITMRELRAVLVYILFGVHNCRDHHDVAEGFVEGSSMPIQPYWNRTFSPDSPARQGEVLRELPRFDPGLEAHPQIDRRLLHPPSNDDSTEFANPKRLDLQTARRRAYFEWTREAIEKLTGDPDALGLAGGRHMRLFRDIAISDGNQKAELVRTLCGGISRLGALPPQALNRSEVVPLRVNPRTPTETAFWVEKSLGSFRLEADVSSGDEKQDELQRQVFLIYRYNDGHEERLRIGADLFCLLLELNEGYQLGDVASDDTFAHLSIFVQRLVQEDHRHMLAWNPMRENEIFEIAANIKNTASEPRQIMSISQIEHSGQTNHE